ncbi:ABC transporter ATP-binding protein [Sulfurovum sp. NBC37-1]|uniref:ABC transporter ATP-binding protein n=1 Tax=Sulfurovum sp. (strain NBC37-1) TaxID=387093 RepID=UPI0002EB6725|nr:ABC transporter ATP-binding protein [Sulfurovum sp. NBC37-1]
MLVQAENVNKTFMGSKVLDNVNLDIEQGDRIAMMGPNGAGKTTLVRAMLGFYHIDSGKISVNGFDPVKNRVDVLKNISFIPQLPPPVKLSLEELLLYVEQSSGVSRIKIFEESDRMDLDLEKHISKPFFKLSGGMKQKLLIAIALSKKSDLLIFDEPTANLDPKGREKFYELLTEIDTECSTLFITHRLDEIEGLVNRKIYMDLGKVVEDERI